MNDIDIQIFQETCLDMGTSTIDNDDLGPDVYFALGLEELKKGAFRTPRALSLLSSLLERSIETNKMLQSTKQIEGTVTIFHGIRAPTLSIQQYIDRIFKYAGCSPSCFVIANIYVDRFRESTGVHLNSLNVHRLLITSVMIAAKFYDDAFFNNAYYARVGGVTTAELNRLEMKFLFGLDFRLHVSVETFKSYCSQLEKESTELLGIERPLAYCRIKENWSHREDSSCARKTFTPTSAQ